MLNAPLPYFDNKITIHLPLQALLVNGYAYWPGTPVFVPPKSDGTSFCLMKVNMSLEQLGLETP